MQNWDMVAVTSDEGWHEVHLVHPDSDVVHVYAETAEVDADGLALFRFVETRPLTDQSPT